MVTCGDQANMPRRQPIPCWNQDIAQTEVLTGPSDMLPGPNDCGTLDNITSAGYLLLNDHRVSAAGDYAACENT
jgi:hypothetical protein